MGDSAQRRLRREMRTVQAMIAIHCRGRHGSRGGLCGDCRDLWEYAKRRVERCPFGADKPTCVNCPVHCYQPAMRERIREVMRYAGPRMPWRHPILTLFHFLDGRRPAPDRPGAPRRP
jgi:predicted amidophosphoribosyltransferase